MDYSNIDKKLFTLVDNNSVDSEKIIAPRYSYWRSVGRVFFKNPVNWVALSLMVIILFLSFIYPMFTSYDRYYSNPFISDPLAKTLAPGAALKYFKNIDTDYSLLKWCFGSGPFGEPQFDSIWYGARISLSLALVCSIINLSVGIIVGAIWGYSKKFDIVMQEIYNIISNVPFLLFVSVFVYVTDPGFWSFVAALTITGWLGIAYFIRTQVIIIRDREYNLASRCLGTPMFRTVTKNILPFLTSVIVTMAATEIPSYISYEVFLTYIGIGIGTDTPTLGSVINSTQTYMDSKPFVFWIPVLVASTITVILYLVGQNLADASDPRTHM